MVAFRGRAVVAAVVCAGVVLAGCSTPPKEAKSVSPPPPPSAAATRQVDLSRLGEIKDAFPPGYLPLPLAGPRTLDAVARDSLGDFVSYGKSLNVSPNSCRPLLKPVAAKAGTETVSVSSDSGPQDPFVSVAVYDPVSVPSALPESGCDRFTFVVQSAVPDGAVHRLAVPKLDNATSYAVRVDFDITNPGASKPVMVEYFYIAILDGRTLVSVWARVPKDFAAEPALPDLLTKAVASLRR